GGDSGAELSSESSSSFIIGLGWRGRARGGREKKPVHNSCPCVFLSGLPGTAGVGVCAADDKDLLPSLVSLVFPIEPFNTSSSLDFDPLDPQFPCRSLGENKSQNLTDAHQRLVSWKIVLAGWLFSKKEILFCTFRNHQGNIKMSSSVPSDMINLRLILVSGKTKEFLFSPNDSAADIAKHVYDNWPMDWEEEQVSSPNILRLIYQGRFLHGNVTLGALKLPFGKTTVMHLVARETLPEPNSQGQRNREKTGESNCCVIL
uniref:Ubiquitin-like protein 3 n=23 Tax=Bifurcata TaxID=1329961 RepID=A0A670I331_PODMU